jgi:NAD(P)-dependent dehydrogenase (short-subunit alcohol dehydrogenase family)
VEHSLDDWNHELNNNLLSAFLASRAVFPHMQNAGGVAIVNFARAGLPQANMLAYNCAKAGIEARAGNRLPAISMGRYGRSSLA